MKKRTLLYIPLILLFVCALLVPAAHYGSLFKNYNKASGQIELKPGDLLVGFTDGISEAINPQEEEWSEDAMLAELKTVTDKSSEEILP